MGEWFQAISIYGITYAVQHNLMQPILWLFSLIYMLASKGLTIKGALLGSDAEPANAPLVVRPAGRALRGRTDIGNCGQNGRRDVLTATGGDQIIRIHPSYNAAAFYFLPPCASICHRFTNQGHSIDAIASSFVSASARPRRNSRNTIIRLTGIRRDVKMPRSFPIMNTDAAPKSSHPLSQSSASAITNAG